jgi:hypothetical protein
MNNDSIISSILASNILKHKEIIFLAFSSKKMLFLILRKLKSLLEFHRPLLDLSPMTDSFAGSLRCLNKYVELYDKTMFLEKLYEKKLQNCLETLAEQICNTSAHGWECKGVKDSIEVYLKTEGE